MSPYGILELARESLLSCILRSISLAEVPLSSFSQHLPFAATRTHCFFPALLTYHWFTICCERHFTEQSMSTVASVKTLVVIDRGFWSRVAECDCMTSSSIPEDRKSLCRHGMVYSGLVARGP